MQSIIQDASNNFIFDGVQECVQLAGVSDSGIFIVQNVGQEAGLNDPAKMYTVVIDQYNQVSVDSNVPIDVKEILDDLEANYYNLGVVPCEVKFPEIFVKDREQPTNPTNPINPPDEPKTIKKLNTDDYIIVLIEGQWDYGDVPNLQYHTLFASDGARHVVVPGFYLGEMIDAEFDGHPTANATGDDTNDTDDEDGVIFTNPLIPGTEAIINVTASYPGILSAWMDFNDDGDWKDAGEKIISDRELKIGYNCIGFDLPATAMQGRAYARFRFSSARGLSFDGPASDGEVEDYRVQIVKPQ